MKSTIRSLAAAVLSIGLSASAFAATKVTTIESSAVIEDLGPRATERIVTITGPDRSTYRIEASPAEVDRLVNIVRANPEARISFRGEVTDLNGSRVFRVDEWREVEKTTTTTTTDSFGNKEVETQTEKRLIR